MHDFKSEAAHMEDHKKIHHEISQLEHEMKNCEKERDPAYKNEHDAAEKARHAQGTAHSHDPYHRHHQKNK